MGKPHGNSSLVKIARPMPRPKGKPGAPSGNRNAWKHGLYGAEMRALFREVAAFRRRAKTAIAHVERLHADRLAASLPLVTQK
jgi:hypothetical protein